MARRSLSPKRSRWFQRLYVWVVVGMIAGIVVGFLAPDFGASLEPVGDAFIALITMLLGPIIFCMVVAGIAAVHDLRKLGAVALRSLIYFEIVTTIAMVFGLVAVNVVRPGADLRVDPASLEVSADAAERIDAAKGLHWSDYFTQLIPSNIVESFAAGSILQILVFSVLFGIALTVVGEPAKIVARGVERLGMVLFTIVRFVTYLAPIGVFGAMAYTVGAHGAAVIAGLVKLIVTFYGTSALFIVIVLGGILLLARLNPLYTLRYFREEVLLALGASSSEVALPGIIRKLEAIGVDKGTAGVSVSAGYSFNLDGTSIYLSLTTVFIAQALGIDLDLGQQLLLLAIMLLSSKGTGGVTGGGFVMLNATVASTGLVPIAGTMLVLGIDRFMSECRAVVNSLGNAVAGLVIARWQGEITPGAANAFMRGRDVPASSEPDEAPAVIGSDLAERSTR
ncbi:MULTISPECIES: cation:dicarboxylate symporter family transporter [unclassified Plantibacter]|uniref:cation:dicarboxylate symporter family transporter n=1 Tax=unclassified Plantibacter TaxID=2624265 RepID=UPI00138F5C76|nr:MULTISPECIES: cation:dicarboxylase symporter family transporter [unclassified Plantibacter]